jgi:hypothetical protein
VHDFVIDADQRIPGKAVHECGCRACAVVREYRRSNRIEIAVLTPTRACFSSASSV